MSEYKKPTDEVHVVDLSSEITHAVWRTKSASSGDKVSFEVWTHFVGNGSDIEIKVEDKRGKTMDKLKGKVYGDYFASTIMVSDKAKEELVFTAKLPKHGLEKKSDILKVIPPVLVTNLKWGQKEARRGDVVKLSADIEGVDDETEVMICIYEYDEDGAHDFITKFPCTVKNKKIEAEWEYEYHEDTDEILTQEEKEKYRKNYNPPEYFFVIDIYRKRFGEKQESGLLEFKDWIEIELLDQFGEPVAEAEYAVLLADGSEVEGKLDSEGFARIEDVVPGPYSVQFPDHEADLEL
jgi:hypothetical protein